MNIEAVIKTGFLKFNTTDEVEAGFICVDGVQSFTLQFEERFKTPNEAHDFLKKRFQALDDALDGFRIIRGDP